MVQHLEHERQKLPTQWTPLVAWWLRIHLPRQGTQPWSLAWEGSACLGATEPTCHNHWTHTWQVLKPMHSGAHAPQQEKLPQWAIASAHHNQRKPKGSNKDQHRQKYTNNLKEKNHQPKILYPVKIAFRNKAEVKTSSDLQKLDHYQQIGTTRNIKESLSGIMIVIPNGLIRGGSTATTQSLSLPLYWGAPGGDSRDA